MEATYGPTPSDAGAACGHRCRSVAEMWQMANQKRSLPPDVQMLVYYCDKPRGEGQMSRFSLPTFSFATHEAYSLGSGMPREWKPPLPFPSYFQYRGCPSFNVQSPELSLTTYLARHAAVHYRGTFSEGVWGHMGNFTHVDVSYRRTPRFRLAMAAQANRDVLDIGFSGIRGRPASDAAKSFMLRNHNFTFSNWSHPKASLARMGVSIPGNGWAGASTLTSLCNGVTTLALIDRNTVDHEGYAYNLGESYFPFMRPDKDFIEVSANTIASVARALNADPKRAFALSQAASRFAKSFLGPNCAVDYLELLTWRYYKWATVTCPSVFNKRRACRLSRVWRRVVSKRFFPQVARILFILLRCCTVSTALDWTRPGWGSRARGGAARAAGKPVRVLESPARASELLFSSLSVWSWLPSRVSDSSWLPRLGTAHSTSP